MFKDREISFNVKPKKDNDPGEVKDPRTLEEKADTIVHIIEKVGVRFLVGVGVYIWLDTRRKVAVARASNPR